MTAFGGTTDSSRRATFTNSRHTPPQSSLTAASIPLSDIRCQSRLGGLLKYCVRKVAECRAAKGGGPFRRARNRVVNLKRPWLSRTLIWTWRSGTRSPKSLLKLEKRKGCGIKRRIGGGYGFRGTENGLAEWLAEGIIDHAEKCVALEQPNSTMRFSATCCLRVRRQIRDLTTA
jgi:hypothetical protein